MYKDSLRGSNHPISKGIPQSTSNSSSSNLSEPTNSSGSSWALSSTADASDVQDFIPHQIHVRLNMPNNSQRDAAKSMANLSIHDYGEEVKDADTSLASTIFGNIGGVTDLGSFGTPEDSNAGATDPFLADLQQAMQPHNKLSMQKIKEVKSNFLKFQI